MLSRVFWILFIYVGESAKRKVMEPCDEFKKGKHLGRLEGVLLGSAGLFLVYFADNIYRAFRTEPFSLVYVAGSCLVPLSILYLAARAYGTISRKMSVGSRWVTPIAWALFFTACLAGIAIVNWMQGVIGYDVH